MAGGVEIERKWLVPEMPREALDGPPPEAIQQGYLTIGAEGAETRVRMRAGRCTLTVKSGGGLERSETEIGITAEQFDALWSATAGARLEKQRRTLRAGDGHTIELDVYGGDLDGLIVAEVEFDDRMTATFFTAPYWFGREVTDDPAYKNQRLATSAEPPSPTSL
ncbi:MAG TPA: CYTH domain-containing protein [Solirubrobacteraceae bacterium]|nr:CYTH domain-containing protein [Solirubrobacteraceae bacterium]